VNTPLLQRIGVFDGRQAAPGGVIVRDPAGVPTGVLQEQAQNLVVAEVTPYSLDRLEGALLAAGRRYAAEGLTHVTECGIGGGWLAKTPLEVAAYTRAREAGLAVRVRLMPSVDALHPVHGHPDDPLTFGLDLGLTTGFGDDLVRLGPMKIWTDGSLLGRTAAMREDFCGCRQRGYLQDDPETMRRQIVAAHRSGWDVAAHAIGDTGVDFALDTFEQAQRQAPRPDARHRIEHAGVVNPDQIPRFAELRVTPVPQARFLYDIGDAMCAAVGEERADLLYRHASFLAAGVRVPGSSDRPVAGGAPLNGIESMVLRRTSSGRVVGPSERVDVRTALRAYTLDAAWIAREEHTRGSLTPGKHADFVVLGDDITAIDPHRIGGTEIVATVLAGLATHDPGVTGLPPRPPRTDTP
jgi:predicted amidohydrolase YtcJ